MTTPSPKDLLNMGNPRRFLIWPFATLSPLTDSKQLKLATTTAPTVMVKFPLKGPSKREHHSKPDFKKVDWEQYQQVLDDLLPNPTSSQYSTSHKQRVNDLVQANHT
jgi:hypothetical protein